MPASSPSGGSCCSPAHREGSADNSGRSEREGPRIDDILVSGGLAGLLAATIRLGASWLAYYLGWQRITLSHVYAMLVLPTVEQGQFGPYGLAIGSLAVVAGWLIVGVILSQLLAWYGFRYWYAKGPGLAAAIWPFVYLASQLAYRGSARIPSPTTPLASFALSLVAGLAAAFPHRWARWPGRRDLGPGPLASHPQRTRTGLNPRRRR